LDDLQWSTKMMLPINAPYLFPSPMELVLPGQVFRRRTVS
jgi:hypothetical protein